MNRNYWILLGALILLTLSPIDLIPDSIPIAGLIDDLLYMIIASYVGYKGYKTHNEEKMLND